MRALSHMGSVVRDHALRGASALYPALFFRTPRYMRLNRTRLAHLASLGLPLEGRSVLDVGAGVGDHARFYLTRGCGLTLTDARRQNVSYMRRRYPRCAVGVWDLECPEEGMPMPHEVVHAYGLLYHVSDPARALAALSAVCTDVLLLETSVDPADGQGNPSAPEHAHDPTQAASGIGCRPARRWVWERLSELFPYVYTPVSRPDHEEFPADWARLQPGLKHYREVFIASRTPLDRLPTLMAQLPMKREIAS